MVGVNLPQFNGHFFSWCSLRCVFCQNREISQKGLGDEAEPEDTAGMMLKLQARGCHNINFVTPSHVVAQIIRAVDIAARRKRGQAPFIYQDPIDQKTAQKTGVCP